MEIPLHLKKHCIETEAKKTYERLLKSVFNKKNFGKENAHIELQIEGLKIFLEQSDFGYLRSAHPILSGGKEISLTLKIADDLSEIAVVAGDKIIHARKKEIT